MWGEISCRNATESQTVIEVIEGLWIYRVRIIDTKVKDQVVNPLTRVQSG